MEYEIYTPHHYQSFSTDKILDNPFYGLLLDMGLGKTISTLTAIVELKQRGEIKKTLVIGPKNVIINTWPDEVNKWAHTRRLRVSVITGSEKERIKALERDADIYTISRDSIAWLVTYLKMKWVFDFVVYDESSSFKDPDSKRFRAIKRVRPLIKRSVILTGTPTGNSLVNIWAQIFLLDGGKRLGETVTGFRNTYFKAAKQRGNVVYSYKLKGASDVYGKDVKESDDLLGVSEMLEYEIYEKISDIVVSMKARNLLDLQPVYYLTETVKLTAPVMRDYKIYERDAVLELVESDAVLTAANAAVLIGKLLQYSGGAVYDKERNAHEIHTAKLDAVEEKIEGLDDENIIIFHWFKHEAERLAERLKKYKPVIGVTPAAVKAWNEGNIKIWILHPQSAGHGLNIQKGGRRIFWYGPIHSLELYQQANARVDRQGQKYSVYIHHFVCPGTMDPEVMLRLEEKEAGQNRLLNAVKAKIKEYIKKEALKLDKWEL